MKTVIEMARSAGGKPQQNKNCDVEYLMSAEALERFAEIVRADAIADEREACAKVCDAWQEWGADGALLAKAIRSRSSEH